METNNIPEIKFKLKTKVIKSSPLMIKYRHAKRIGQKEYKFCKNLNWKRSEYHTIKLQYCGYTTDETDA